MNDHKRLNLRGCIAAASVTVNLSTNDSRVCALIGGDLIEGLAGYGSSIHEALHDLADKIAENDILPDEGGVERRPCHTLADGSCD